MMSPIAPQDLESFSANLTRNEMMEWFHKRLQRPPELADILKFAKEFYQLGAFSRALLCLQYYVRLDMQHLMAYCYLNLGELEKALMEFKRCVKDGYHEDWQMVVEISLDLENLIK